MSDAAAVTGVRRAYKEMVDGTIRVVIEIAPTEKRAFLELFGCEIDTPVALAPLKFNITRERPPMVIPDENEDVER